MVTSYSALSEALSAVAAHVAVFRRDLAQSVALHQGRLFVCGFHRFIPLLTSLVSIADVNAAHVAAMIRRDLAQSFALHQGGLCVSGFHWVIPLLSSESRMDQGYSDSGVC